VTVLLRMAGDVADVPLTVPWLSPTARRPIEGRAKYPATAELLHQAFDEVRDEWWQIGRQLGGEPGGEWSHAASCASMNSDLGTMLAWDRVARGLAGRTGDTLLICDDPWLFRHLATLDGISAGRYPALVPAAMRLRIRGVLARIRFVWRALRALAAVRHQRDRAAWKNGAVLLVYAHPASDADGQDAYFGSLLKTLPGLGRAIHTDGDLTRAQVLSASTHSVSLHAFGSIGAALRCLTARWRPGAERSRGPYGWLIRRAAAREGAGAAAAATSWQTRCQEAWLDAVKPRVVAWPWENHPWERAFVRAAQQRGVTTIGYQHTVVGRHMYNQSPSSNPNGMAGLPDLIICGGPAYCRQLESWGIPRDRLAVGGSFRIATASPDVHDPKGPVFVALAADHRIAAQMMDAVRGLAAEGHLRFVVKAHPMYPFAFSETERLRRTDKVLAQQTAVSAVIYSTGTVGLEALFSNLPVVRFLPEGIVATDILPEGLTVATADRAHLEAALSAVKPPSGINPQAVISPVDLSVWRQHLRAA
jgi:hypothetical protein